MLKFFVKKLSETIHGSNQNITIDNWFNSVPLATLLLDHPYKLTIVGTLCKDKHEIPPKMVNLKGRKIGLSMFCFDEFKTVVSYKVKNNKVVLLLPTCDEKSTIDPNSKKLHIIEIYKVTKSGVDSMDQLCNQMSSSCKSKRWPHCVFYGMINIALVISYVIYISNIKLGLNQ